MNLVAARGARCKPVCRHAFERLQSLPRECYNNCHHIEAPCRSDTRCVLRLNQQAMLLSFTGQLHCMTPEGTAGSGRDPFKACGLYSNTEIALNCAV